MEWIPGLFPDEAEDLTNHLKNPLNPLGLYEYRRYKDISIIQGSGLGGTSLINANVAIIPEPNVLDQDPWPSTITSKMLAPYYDDAAKGLNATQHPKGMDLLKVQALNKRAAQLSGSRLELLKLAVNFTVDGIDPVTGVERHPCTDCGDCVTGCNIRAKNTLYMNYLPLAKKSGVEIFTQVKVKCIEPELSGGFSIRYERFSPRHNLPESGTIRANRAVVVSAGSLGSTEIMLQSRDKGLKLSDTVGTRFSGNGDFFGIAYNSDQRTDIMGFGNHPNDPPRSDVKARPTIVGVIRYNRDKPLKEQIEGVWDMAAVSNNNHRTGVARLDFDVKPDGRIEGRYQFMNLVQGQTRVELTEDELQMHDFTPMHDEIRTLDNDYMIGKWCSAKKEIFGPLSAGLLHFEPTSDGQTRFCFYYTLKRSNLDRLPAPGVLDRVMRQKLGVGMTFEEEMVGRYSPGELRDSRELEPDQGIHCQFNVKIIIADLDEFIASEEHRAELNGTIQFAEFNGVRNVVCPLEDGSYFNYLRKNPDTEGREMRYHIRFKHRDKLYLFNGTKFLQKDHKGDVAEILEDYTTLYCRITQEDNYVQTGAAKLKFRTTEDIKSIASMLEFGLSFEVTGTKSLWKKISARNKMNAFTMHFIFDEYNPLGL